MSLLFHDEPYRPSRRLSTIARIAGCRIDVVAAADAGALAADWRELGTRAIEPNPFAAPDVVLPAALHLADADDLSLVTIRDDVSGRLTAVAPMAPPGRLAGLSGARLWWNRHLPLATPLVDTEQGHQAMRALLRWLGERRPAFSGVTLPRQTANGPFLRLLAEVTLAEGLAMATASTATTLPLAEDRQPPTTRGAQGRDAVERLLELDATGERRHGRTAILQDVGQTTFVRAAVRAMIRTGVAKAQVFQSDDHDDATAAVRVQVGDSWRTWLSAGSARDSLPGSSLALVDVHVGLKAGGATSAFTERARMGLARALWMAGRSS